MTFTSTIFKNKAVAFEIAGVIGIAMTAAFAAWGQYKADEEVKRIEKDEEEKFFSGESHVATFTDGRIDALPMKYRVLKTWKYYIPVAIAGAVTGACFFFGLKYARVDAIKSFTPIPLPVQKPTKKPLDATKSEKQEIVYDPETQYCVIDTGDGDELFYDAWTDKYFYSNKEFLLECEDKFNDEIDNGKGFRCLMDWYKMIHLYSAVKLMDSVNRYYFDRSRGYLLFDYGFNYCKGDVNCTALVMTDGPFEPDTDELNG